MYILCSCRFSLVMIFSYIPLAMFSREELFIHCLCKLYWGVSLTLLISMLVWTFSFSEVFLLHSSCRFYHMVISGYLDHQSTQFMLSARELLLFVSVVLVLMNALMTTKKEEGIFQILFDCLNRLICCTFRFSLSSMCPCYWALRTQKY